MVDAGTLLTYLCVVLGLFLIPGPAVLLVLGRASTGGRRVGIATGLGIACGDSFHAAAAALGLSAVLTTSAMAFSLVKYAGVAYLLYLGIRALAEKNEGVQIVRTRAANASRAFRQAVLTEILNPKTALFFLAFLPTFLDPRRGPLFVQVLVLGMTFITLGLISDGAYALTASYLATRWRGRRARRGATRAQRWSGLVYIGLGVVALRPTVARPVRAAAWLAALAMAGWIVSVAFTKTPWGFFTLI